MRLWWSYVCGVYKPWNEPMLDERDLGCSQTKHSSSVTVDMLTGSRKDVAQVPM